MNTNLPEQSTEPPMGYDLWGKGQLGDSFNGQIRDDDIFLGEFDMYVIIDTYPTWFYLRLPGGDCMELINVDASGCTALLARKPLDPDVSVLEQSMRILLEVFLAWAPYQYPCGFTETGLLKHEDWLDLETRLEEALRPRDSSEADDPHGLLGLVKQLGQEVNHKGGDSDFYFTRCPANHRHRIDLRPASGEWYCGWCPEGGRVPDLRRFYKKHGHDL